MVIKKKLIFFILFFILNFHSLLASAFYPEDSIKPYCEGKIQGGLDNRKIEKLEIRAKNNRAWSTNLLQVFIFFRNLFLHKLNAGKSRFTQGIIRYKNLIEILHHLIYNCCLL